MTTPPAWQTHFKSHDDLQRALYSICEQVDKLESGPRQDPLDHPCRKQFSSMLMKYGESVCEKAYQATHDAVIGGRNGEREPVWVPSAYIQIVAKKIAEEG